MALTINHQTNDISATSGSVTIDGAAVGGAWSIVSSYSSTSDAVNTFSGLSGYDFYRLYISVNVNGSATATPYLRVNNDTGSNYGFARAFSDEGGTYLDAGSSSSDSIQLNPTGAPNVARMQYAITVTNLHEAEPTVFHVSYAHFKDTTQFDRGVVAGAHITATAYDNFEFYLGHPTLSYKVLLLGASV